MAKKSSTDKKKKGPKGKRARAKAKLERQWGEESNETSTKRVGRSRLLARKEKEASSDEEETAAVNALPERKVNGDVDSSDEEGEDEEMDLAQGGAFSKLMKTLGNTTTPSVDSDEESEEADAEDKHEISEEESNDMVEEESEGEDQSAFDAIQDRFVKKEPLP